MPSWGAFWTASRSPRAPAPAESAALAAAVRRRVRGIEIRAKTLRYEQFMGDYRSAFRGRGLEFHQIRAYLPGDDARFIDWKVTARRATPYIKQFVEERELTVLLLLDVSASESFGTVGRSVRDFATEVAGVLGYAAALNSDRVGALAFSDRLEYSLPPRKGSRHVLRLIHDLVALQPQGRGTNLAQPLEQALRVLRRGSVVIVISDFHADGWEPSLRRLARKHDAVALVAYDPREATIGGGGLVTIEDAESGQPRIVDAGQARRVLQAESARRSERLASRLRAVGADFAFLPSDRDYVPALAALFRARTRRH